MNAPQYLYIDPQSIGSLARYSYNLLTNIKLPHMGFVCNANYDAGELCDIKIYPWFKYSRYHKIRKVFSYLLTLLKITILIIKCKPKIVHIAWIRIEILEYVIYRLLRYLIGFKLIYTAHNVLPHDSGDKYKKIYTSWYKMVDSIIVHTTYTKQEIINLGIEGSHIFVSRHGIISKIELGNSAVENFREKYHLDNKIIFSLTGVQSPYKGTDIAIKAWISNKVLNNSNNSILVIMGKNNGTDYSNISKSTNILLIDRSFSEMELESLFNATDVLLLPYRNISQSGVLLTALSYKLPIICSNIGGLAEAMSVADIGWTLDEITSDNLSAKMEYVTTHQEELKKKRNNAYEWEKIKKYYSWEEIGKMTKDLYYKLLSDSRITKKQSIT